MSALRDRPVKDPLTQGSLGEVRRSIAECERMCVHDLVRGVLIEELLGTDGPEPVGWRERLARSGSNA